MKNQTFQPAFIGHTQAGTILRMAFKKFISLSSIFLIIFLPVFDRTDQDR